MMSSCRMQVRPATSPITFITSAVPSSERRLSMIASSASSRFAYARARSAPPASGDTIVRFGLSSVSQVLDDHRRGEQVIDRNVKEPLDLRLVQVHRQHPIRPGGGDQVRHQLRGDRHPRLVLAILPRVAVIRNHGRDARRRRAAERIDHHAQLDQMPIDVRAGRLHDEDVGAADVLVDLERDLGVREPLQPRVPDLDPEELRDLLGQGAMRAARKDLELPAGRRLPVALPS